MLKKTKIFVSSLAISVGLACISVPLNAASIPHAADMTISRSACFCMGEHEFGAMSLLSEISGKSVTEIQGTYPQKTAWQAAKAMGKLDDLKTAYLSRARVMIDRLVEDRGISTQDGARMYADIQKRVAAIDGVNTVITGRPNFKPQFKQ